MNKEKITKCMKGGRTASIWILAYFVYVACFNILSGLSKSNHDDVCTGFFAIIVGGVFFWLFSRVKKEPSFKNFSWIFLGYFGYGAFNIGNFFAFVDYSTMAVKLAIYTPILISLGRAVFASSHIKTEKEKSWES